MNEPLFPHFNAKREEAITFGIGALNASRTCRTRVDDISAGFVQ